MSDEEVLKLCIKGDRKAQEMLYKKFAAPMARLCLRYLKDNHLAKEIVVEGFLKVFSSLHKLEKKAPERLEAWIRKIMVNECLMKLRKERKLLFSDTALMEMPSHGTIEDNYSAEEIFNLIAGLPDGYRTIFNLYVVEGYSHKEIAETIGISESTSRSQLTYARTKLKELILKKGWK